MKKVVLIGANHAGTAAANTILDNSDLDLTIFDANDNISYLGCGTALAVGKQIDGFGGLFYSSKEDLEKKGAKVYMESPVSYIDFENKEVTASTKDGDLKVKYDDLILATGSLPIIPNIKGLDLDGVHGLKFYQDGTHLYDELADESIKKIAVIGAGYIGVEIAEAIERRGKHCLLFEAASTSLANYYDEWFAQDMDEVLKNHNIELHYQEMVQELTGESHVQGIVTNKGNYEVDLVIFAIGFRANTELGKETLEIGVGNAYSVDKHQQTSLKNVYAIGDCATIFNNASQQKAYIALATNAVRSGVVAAFNVMGTSLESNGVQGSNGICIYDYKMVSTGLSVHAATKLGFDVEHTDFEDWQKPAFIKENNQKVKIRIVYDKQTRRVLGAQMASYLDISMGIHMFSLAIEQQVTIDDLKLLDIFFLPHFNQPYNYITMAALSAK